MFVKVYEKTYIPAPETIKDADWMAVIQATGDLVSADSIKYVTGVILDGYHKITVTNIDHIYNNDIYIDEEDCQRLLKGE